jgi:hypothetical protein
VRSYRYWVITRIGMAWLRMNRTFDFDFDVDWFMFEPIIYGWKVFG